MNRTELVFLYEAEMCNPNGDPMDSNKPRMNESNGHCIVTDVRLKRTIRDYLINFKGYNGTDPKKDVFVREVNGKPTTLAERAKSYSDKGEFLSKFIDARLFGGVSAEKGKSFSITGPLQFSFGKSLHPVEVIHIKGTGAFTTKEDAQQKTFSEEYRIAYGLIGFHGILNENAAKETNLSDADYELLLEALWNGTATLSSHSKKGHTPMLLLEIQYKDGFMPCDSLNRIKASHSKGKDVSGVSCIEDLSIDISMLNKSFKDNWDMIEGIRIVNANDRLLATLTEPIATK